MTSPRGFSVVLPLANTPYKLVDLFPAGNNEYKTHTYQCINLQVDIDAGGVRVYVGNDDLSTTNWMYKVTGSQAVPLNVPGSPNVDPNAIYLLSNTSNVRLGVALFLL